MRVCKGIWYDQTNINANSNSSSTMEALHGSRAVYVDGRGDMMECAPSYYYDKNVCIPRNSVNGFCTTVSGRANIKANVSKKLTDKTNVDRLVLGDVIVDGSYFRDHVWIKNTKRLSGLSVGDEFTATALMYVYSSSEGQKLGLKTFRNVEKI